jgi:nicotinate phosphoribosyltransferase
MHPQLSITPAYTDLYQLTMGQVYFLKNHHHQEASFDYFFRKLPFSGGYVVFAGLYDVLELISEFRFSDNDIAYLRNIGLDKAYMDYLRAFEFKGSVYACQEGDVIFPNVPAVRVEGTLLESQIIETVLLNFINFQSLVATKAARVRQVAGDRILLDFGLRRAQGLGGYHAARACIIGGFNATSNVKAAIDFAVPCSGTMAHSFVQHYDNELSAFRSFAEGRPDNCVLLVDTYNTLKSGVPNAIIVAREMEKRGHRLEGIRLDSGDLAYLSTHARRMLDEAGLHYVKIAASNQLDEDVIKSLLEQGASIDVFGVGTNLVTGQPDAALDGVYKLAYSDGVPRIKLSESLSKTTLPHKKQVYRIFDDGMFLGADAITLEDESAVNEMFHPVEPAKSMRFDGSKSEPLLHKVMEKGRILIEKKSLQEIAAYSQSRLAMLPQEYKRFQNPHAYKVGISGALQQLRNDLRNKYLSRENA